MLPPSTLPCYLHDGVVVFTRRGDLDVRRYSRLPLRKNRAVPSAVRSS